MSSSGPNNLRRASAWLALGQLGNLLPSVLMMPLLFLFLEPSEYGELVYGLAAFALVSVLADFGLSVRGTEQVALAQGLKRRAVAVRFQSARVVSGIGGAAVMLALACSPLVPNGYGSAVLAGGLSVFGYQLVPLWYFRGIRSPASSVLTMALGRVALLLVVVLMLLVQVATPTSVIIAQGVMWIGVSVVNGCRMDQSLGGGLAFDVLAGLSTLRESFSFAGGAFGWAVLGSGGLLILGHWVPAAELAVYGLLDQFFRAGKSLRDSIAEALFPYAAQERNSQMVLRVGGRVTLTVAALTTGTLVCLNIVRLGTDGLPASLPWLLVCLFCVLFTVDTAASFLGYPLFATLGRTAEVNIVAIGAAVVYVVPLILVGWAGALNAEVVVLGSCACTLLFAVTLYARYRFTIRG